MAKNQYPPACPAFRYLGRDYMGRPEWDKPETFGPGLTLVANRSIDDDYPMHILSPDEEGLVALTSAAEELLAWCRQYTKSEYPDEAVVFSDRQGKLWEYIGPSVYTGAIRVYPLDPPFQSRLAEKDELNPLTPAAADALSINCVSHLGRSEVLLPGMSEESLAFEDEVL